MSYRQKVDEQEEILRDEISALQGNERREFFVKLEKQIKDPDTYAVLNCFMFGFHHYYLGRWIVGSINILIFCLALFFAYEGEYKIALIVFAIIFIIELKDLFFAQTIVKDYNNKVTKKLLSLCKQNIK